KPQNNFISHHEHSKEFPLGRKTCLLK
ncbi:hypothetical protein CP09DC78_0935B, partial [Chlamydia psittaci 09DC78]